MRRGGTRRATGKRFTAFSVLAAVAVLLASPGDAPAVGNGLVSGSYQFNWDQTVDKTETETTDTRVLKQAVEIKYRGFLNPKVFNEVTFKFEQEVNSATPDYTRFMPTLDLGIKAFFWEAKLGAKRTHENSDEPGRNPKTTDSYFLELMYNPPRAVPDLKTKFTLDKDFEEGVTDTEKKGATFSSVYKLWDALDLKGEYNWTDTTNGIQADSDMRDQKYTFEVAFRHLFTKKIRFNTEFKQEIAKSLTFKSDGSGTVEGTDKNDVTRTWKNLLAFRPFRDTALEGSYDLDLKQNIVNGEDQNLSTAKVIVAQKILSPFEVRGQFQRVTADAKHTKDDNTKTEDTWTLEGKAKLSKMFDLSLKQEDKHTTEVHPADGTKNQSFGTVTTNADWLGEITPFWKASLSYIKTVTTAFNFSTVREETSTVENKYNAKSTFDFKAINFLIEPTYEVTFKEDHTLTDPTKPTNYEIRDFKFRVAYRFFPTVNMEAKIDHTYGRKTDSLLNNIQRMDNTNGNLTWKDPAPGWTIAFDLTRIATDTSGDDLEADITTSAGVKADFKKNNLTLGTSFKYDHKSLTGDTENFDAKGGWTAPYWDLSLTYTYRKTFATVTTPAQEGYTISLTFKYNL